MSPTGPQTSWYGARRARMRASSGPTPGGSAGAVDGGAGGVAAEGEDAGAAGAGAWLPEHPAETASATEAAACRA